jgi:hypothetical protein
MLKADLSGRVALLTGSARTIGQPIDDHFAANDARALYPVQQDSPGPQRQPSVGDSGTRPGRETSADGPVVGFVSAAPSVHPDKPR